MPGFPADQAPGACDGAATHQHTGHDSGAVRGAETGSAETAAPFVRFHSVAVVHKRFTLICCATFSEPFFLHFLFLVFADLFFFFFLKCSFIT